MAAKNSAVILGIDAAWTVHHPSGVALVELRKRGQPRLLRLGRSYEEFCRAESLQKAHWRKRARGTSPDIAGLLRACEQSTDVPPQVVALDIPLSHRPITQRRACDNLVTSAYGSRWAGTHSPSAQRPGEISNLLAQQLCAAGYDLKTNDSLPISTAKRSFIESYPHPAIIELLHLPKRLAYKTSRMAQYWPELTPQARRLHLCRNLNTLRDALAHEIEDVKTFIPSARTLLQYGGVAALKGMEDALDAIVCAWSGLQFWKGKAVAYGNTEAAIWLPMPLSPT
ncbi:DUF429 domain-containing protein [candidate division KSB1 bacterium]|nr:DUF429 domain-containing protein [candidate division KSB1 bacterium]